MKKYIFFILFVNIITLNANKNQIGIGCGLNSIYLSNDSKSYYYQPSFSLNYDINDNFEIYTDCFYNDKLLYSRIGFVLKLYKPTYFLHPKISIFYGMNSIFKETEYYYGGLIPIDADPNLIDKIKSINKKLQEGLSIGFGLEYLIEKNISLNFEIFTGLLFAKVPNNRTDSNLNEQLGYLNFQMKLIYFFNF